MAQATHSEQSASSTDTPRSPPPRPLKRKLPSNNPSAEEEGTEAPPHASASASLPMMSDLGVGAISAQPEWPSTVETLEPGGAFFPGRDALSGFTQYIFMEMQRRKAALNDGPAGSGESFTMFMPSSRSRYEVQEMTYGWPPWQTQQSGKPAERFHSEIPEVENIEDGAKGKQPAHSQSRPRSERDGSLSHPLNFVPSRASDGLPLVTRPRDTGSAHRDNSWFAPVPPSIHEFFGLATQRRSWGRGRFDVMEECECECSICIRALAKRLEAAELYSEETSHPITASMEQRRDAMRLKELMGPGVPLSQPPSRLTLSAKASSQGPAGTSNSKRAGVYNGPSSAMLHSVYFDDSIECDDSIEYDDSIEGDDSIECDD